MRCHIWVSNERLHFTSNHTTAAYISVYVNDMMVYGNWYIKFHYIVCNMEFSANKHLFFYITYGALFNYDFCVFERALAFYMGACIFQIFEGTWKTNQTTYFQFNWNVIWNACCSSDRWKVFGWLLVKSSIVENVYWFIICISKWTFCHVMVILFSTSFSLSLGIFINYMNTWHFLFTIIHYLFYPPGPLPSIPTVSV